MTIHRKALGLAAGLVLAGMAFAGPANAQTDTRFTPYYGCWQPAGGSSDGSMICFRPTDAETGVEMLTVADGEIVLTEYFRADGSAQSIEREGCTGSESAAFSEDSRRIYTRSLYTCDGDVTRTATGIMSITAPNQWVDVRSIGVEGQQMAWVQFYETASAFSVAELGLADITTELGMAIRSARMAASVPLDVEDVLDAAAHVDAKTVEAWIAERGDRFDLNGESLLALADAGLDEALIDVMVAVSNPTYFRLDGQPEQVAAAPSAADMRSGWNRFPYGRAYDAFFLDPFYYGLSARYSYGYSPWGYRSYGNYGGYGGYGGYGWYGGYSPRPIVVTPIDEGPNGRVVNGRGYSSGGRGSAGSGRRPASSVGSGGSGSSSRGAVSRTGGYSGGSAARSSGGSATRSSGSSSSGRTAVRRGGGGGS